MSGENVKTCDLINTEYSDLAHIWNTSSRKLKSFWEKKEAEHLYECVCVCGPVGIKDQVYVWCFGIGVGIVAVGIVGGPVRGRNT